MSTCALNNFIFIFCFISSFLVLISHGHVFRLGDCPKIDVQKDFNIKKFLGPWYVIQKFRTSSNCVAENITNIGNEYYISENLEPLGVSVSQKGKITFLEGQPESMMKISFPITAPLGDQNYQVIMTDYESYAAVWSCQRILFGHRESAQIMSRKPTLDNAIVQKIRNRFESYGINEHYFSVVDQASCKWDENGAKRSNIKEECTTCNDLSFRLGPIKIQHRPSAVQPHIMSVDTYDP